MLLGHARMHPWVQSCALGACGVRAVRCANSKHVQQVHAAAGVHAETSASAGAIGCEVQCNRMCCKQSTDVQCECTADDLQSTATTTHACSDVSAQAPRVPLHIPSSPRGCFQPPPCTQLRGPQHPPQYRHSYIPISPTPINMSGGSGFCILKP
jgi:hypothetical protein